MMDYCKSRDIAPALIQQAPRPLLGCAEGFGTCFREPAGKYPLLGRPPGLPETPFRQDFKLSNRFAFMLPAAPFGVLKGNLAPEVSQFSRPQAVDAAERIWPRGGGNSFTENSEITVKKGAG